jgi:tetratricopeptide (TPR) repeat protein
MSDDLLLTLSDDETFTPADASPPPGGEALALAARGDWARAERLFDDARAAATRAGDDVALAVALTNRGQALARLGRLEEAALTLDAALAVRRRLHEAGAAGEAVVARGVADVAALAAALGDLAEATRLLRLVGPRCAT